MDQISMFDLMYPTFKTDNPVRLIELFAGVGSQAMALRNLGVPFEHYLMSEWEMHATASYKAIHMADDDTDYSADNERLFGGRGRRKVLYQLRKGAKTHQGLTRERSVRRHLKNR